MPDSFNDGDKTRTHVILTAGMMVGHYRIIEKIGSGGMGEVYRAEDTKLKREVALKFLPAQLCQIEDAKLRFTREAQAAAALKHPNIVTIYEVSEYLGRPYFVMECCEGRPLRDLIKEQKLAVDRIIDLAIQICEGLQEAHEAGVVHRDIKPSNIILDKKGRPKLLDFGLAAVRGAEQLTRTGSTLGTIGYMPPEQIRAGETDHRSDLFSFGVVLYEMITGQQPFGRENEAATLNAILKDTPEPLARFKADVSDELQRIVDSALDKDVETRYQTAGGILADLKRLRKISDSKSIAALPPIPGKRGYKDFLIPVLMVILALAILIFKPWKFEIAPSQEVVAAENRLAIMYFDNLTDPEDDQRLGKIITSLLITDLSESDYIQVVSSQRLYDILKLLGRGDETKVDRNVASRVAEKANARWMLLGDILQIEPNIILTSQLVDVASGNAVASQRIEGGQGEEIFALVDKLTIELKNDLSLPAAAGDEPDRPVANVTTHSAEAYRNYIEGIEFEYKLYTEDARKSFRLALQHDSTFATAYYHLAGLERGPLREELTKKAVEYASGASKKEQMIIKGFELYEQGKYTQTIESIKRLLEKYPDDKDAYFIMAIIYGDRLGLCEEAIHCLKKAVEIDPLFKNAYNQFAYTYTDLGDLEKALWAINKYIELAPDEANPYDTRGDLYAFGGRIDQAIESYNKALKLKPDFYTSRENLGHMYLYRRDYTAAESHYQKLCNSEDKYVRSKGRNGLALIPLYQGKLDEALRVLDDALAADRMENIGGWRNELKFGLKSDIYDEKNMLDSALHQVASIPSLLATYIMLLVKAGRISDATRKAEVLKEYIVQKDSSAALLHEYYFASGMIEQAKANIEIAIEYLEKSLEEARDPYFYYRYYLAEAYLSADRLAEAVSVLEQGMKRFDSYRAYVPTLSVKAHYLLGQAYEKSGWIDKATEQYEIFLDIWKDADDGLESVKDARERLERLRSES